MSAVSIRVAGRLFRVNQHSLSADEFGHIPFDCKRMTVFVAATAVHGGGQTPRSGREDLDVRLAKETKAYELVPHPDDIIGCFTRVTHNQVGRQTDGAGKFACCFVEETDKALKDRIRRLLHQGKKMILGVFGGDSQKLSRVVAQKILKQ